MSGRFVSIGECMVELSHAGDGTLRKAYAGDTLNTAWYARAILPPNWTVDYVTAVGEEELSSEMLTMMNKANIGTDFVRRIPGGTPGLYMISLKNGERSFSYWRDSSAARQLADDAGHLRHAIAGADLIYFSGITLGILSEPAVQILFAEIKMAKSTGSTIVFDPNIRPRLWSSRDYMLATIEVGARASDIVLPSFDDEANYFGDLTVADTLNRYHAWGAQRVVVKDGERGATYSFPKECGHIAAVKAAKVVDTTSAGDGFNGGFLAKFLDGASPRDATIFGARVASTIIEHPGALIEPMLLPASNFHKPGT